MRTSHLHHQLCDLLGQSSEWADRRHLQTVIWMVIGLICSECISKREMGHLYAEPSKICPEPSASLQSVVALRAATKMQRLYSPLIATAMANWEASEIVLIEDTTMLWDEYCLIRLSIQYRGRAIPLVWRVLHHGSSSVTFEVYQGMLKRAGRLIPPGVSVRFLADRGKADTRDPALLARLCCSGISAFESKAMLGFIVPTKVGNN